MKLVHTVAELREEVAAAKAQGLTIGWCLLWALCMKAMHP